MSDEEREDEIVEEEEDDHHEEEAAPAPPAPEPEVRRGGPQGDDDEADKKAAERERKKAEVRARLQEAGKAKKAKKGFLTPDRKKKLRKLLMAKAAEDLKQQQLMKEQERQRILQERIIPCPNVDTISDKGQLESLIKQFHDRIIAIETEKYDLDLNVRSKDFEINELTIAVNDLRGKFVKPTLKKVSKYDNKFKKLQAANEEKKMDFRSNLKNVKKDTFDINDLLGTKAKGEAADWAQKKGGEGGDAAAPSEEAPAEEAAAEE
jgi:hypothetical protein